MDEISHSGLPEQASMQMRPEERETIRGKSFARYQRRKADNTIRRHKADLALFEVYLAERGHPLAHLVDDPSVWQTVTAEFVEAFVEWQLEYPTRCATSCPSVKL